jgi:WD40 repeat protein
MGEKINLNEHTSGVWDVAFSPNAQMIATSSSDRTVKLWKLDGTLITTVNGHTASVEHIVFSSDGKTLASASNDQTVILWDLNTIVQPDSILKYGCDWVRDYLRTNALVEESDSLRDSFASRTLCDEVKTQNATQ